MKKMKYVWLTAIVALSVSPLAADCIDDCMEIEDPLTAIQCLLDCPIEVE